MIKLKLWLITIIILAVCFLLFALTSSVRPETSSDLPATVHGVILAGDESAYQRHGFHSEPTREDLLERRIADLEYQVERIERVLNIKEEE